MNKNMGGVQVKAMYLENVFASVLCVFRASLAENEQPVEVF